MFDVVGLDQFEGPFMVEVRWNNFVLRFCSVLLTFVQILV